MNKAFVSCIGLLSALVGFESAKADEDPYKARRERCRRAGTGHPAASSANPEQQLVGRSLRGTALRHLRAVLTGPDCRFRYP